MARKQILVVEDESVVAMNIRTRLQRMGYKVPPVVATGKEAVKKATEIQPDLVLMDVMLKEEMDGVEAAEKIRAAINVPVVYLTAYADDKTVQRAKYTEPYGYILKPFQVKELKTTIEMALHKHKIDVSIRENRAWLANTLKSISQGIITTNSTGAITYLNPAAEDLTGWTNDEAGGKDLLNIFAVIDQQTRKIMDNPALRAIREGKVVGLDKQAILIKRDGSEIPVGDESAPIRNDKDSIEGVVVVFYDDTERMESEKLQSEWREAAERATKLKKEFLSNIDHEIRKPLHIILGYANLIEEVFGKNLDSKYRQYFINIRDASRHLLDTLNMLVEISRFHVNDFPIRPKEIFVMATLQDCIDKYAALARKKELEFNVELLAEDVAIFADPYAITSAIANVLSNAVKFTAKGAINIHLYTIDKERVSISISDTGMGIQEDDLPIIFEEFSKGKEQHSQESNGIGLGLALTKHFVEHSKGSITVKTQPNRGTEITISFPVYNRQEKTVAEPVAAEQHSAAANTLLRESANKTILLVEDDEITQRLVSLRLLAGYDVHSAKSAREARAILEKTPVDAILMDISLQGKEDGLEFTRKLKADTATRNIPIIVITAHASDKDRKKAFAAGCDAYLSKPFDLTELENTIKTWFGKSDEN